MKCRFCDLIADRLEAFLRDKWVKLGNDRTWRGVDTIEKKGTRWKVTYTDGTSRFITDAATIQVKDDGGFTPPSRNS